jgi:hypothetical protein
LRRDLALTSLTGTFCGYMLNRHLVQRSSERELAESNLVSLLPVTTSTMNTMLSLLGSLLS